MKARASELEPAYKQVVDHLRQIGYEDDPNFRDTPARMARWMQEAVWPRKKIISALRLILRRKFPIRDDNIDVPSMQSSVNNLVWGLCPHHLLPIAYRISISYIPENKVLGISKLSRMAELVCKMPILQEEVGPIIARLLYRGDSKDKWEGIVGLNTKGSAAYVEGWHLCMACRGTKHPEAKFIDSALRGIYTDDRVRNEFLSIIKISKDVARITI